MDYDAHQPLGATVTGVDLNELASAGIEELKQLLATHGVIVVPDQQIDDTGFLAFLSRFGELTFTIGETPVPGFPDLNVISNVGRETPPRSSFHADSTYLRTPPAYTALRAVEVPARGGQTVFSNQYRAFDTLPQELKDLLQDRTITHVVTGLELDDDQETSAQHPVLLQHPVSGRTALYMSTPARCAAISGLPEAEAAELVSRLYEHSTEAQNTVVHKWSPGDVVMWDNRCVLHRADHSDVTGDRVMHRGMVLAA